MNRRSFITTIASVLAGTVALFHLPDSAAMQPKISQRFTTKYFHGFEILEDGTLSLHGQTKFPIYSKHGGLSARSMKYRLLPDGRVEAREISKLGEWNGLDVIDKSTVLSRREFAEMTA